MRPSLAATLLVVGVGVVARIAVAVLLGDRFHFADEAIYVDAAGRIAHGGALGAQYRSVPGYPFMLAALRTMAPPGILGLRVAQATVTAAGGALVVALAGTLVGLRAAVAAGLLYALDPLLAVSGSLLYPDAVAAVLLAALVLAGSTTGPGSTAGRAAAIGIGLGALALLRPAALATVPVLAAWVAAGVGGAARRRVLHATLVVAACALALAPWTYRNYRLHGALAPIAVAGTHTAPVAPADVQAHGLTGALLREAVEHPWMLAAHVGREFLHFWELYPQRLSTDNDERRAQLHADDPRLPTEATFPAALRDRVATVASTVELGLALLGLGVLWRERRAHAVLLVALMVALGLAYALFIGKTRYRIPVVPLLLVLAGAGAAGLVRSVGR